MITNYGYKLCKGDQSSSPVPCGNGLVTVTVPVPDLVLSTVEVALPMLLVAFTVKLEVPAVVGVPEMVLPERSNPLGRLPLSNDHVIGVSPVARV